MRDDASEEVDEDWAMAVSKVLTSLNKSDGSPGQPQKSPHGKHNKKNVPNGDRDDSKRRKKRDDRQKNAHNPPPSQVPDAGQIARQRTEELTNVVTETWGQALTGLSAFGNRTKEFAENTSKQVGDSANNAVNSIGGTSTGE
jgi:hypothetical protein